MTNWAVDTHSFGPAALDTVLGEIEDIIEATGGGLYEGALIIEA